MLNATAPCALVAEDDVLIRLEACEILKEAGFRCYDAATAEKALDILHEHGRDIRLLFSDVHMPPGSLTGFDLARQCAQDWPHIRILIASGAATPVPGDMPTSAEFITKPFTATVIRDHLRKVLPNVERPEPLQDSEPGLRRSLNKE